MLDRDHRLLPEIIFRLIDALVAKDAIVQSFDLDFVLNVKAEHLSRASLHELYPFVDGQGVDLRPVKLYLRLIVVNGSRDWHPLRMILCDAFPRVADHPQVLVFLHLAQDNAIFAGIKDLLHVRTPKRDRTNPFVLGPILAREPMGFGQVEVCHRQHFIPLGLHIQSKLRSTVRAAVEAVAILEVHVAMVWANVWGDVAHRMARHG
mmetsp:Transcript_67117/g.143615  ORF Transcript_67117/g.143615 Transcript_67117/m.143615 type:complete len:206 (-) Transcript_67117:337-954(-)